MRTFTLALILLVLAVACQPGTKGVFTSKTEAEMTLARDGTITVSINRNANGKGEVIAPKNAATAPSIEVTETGVTTSGSGSLPEAAIDYITKGSTVYYWISAACLIGAVFVFWFAHQATAAMLLGILGGLFMFAPSMVKYMGRAFAYVVVSLFIAAIVAMAVSVLRSHFKKKKDAARFVKLVKEDKPDEATAALRTADPVVDKAFKKQKAVDDKATKLHVEP